MAVKGTESWTDLTSFDFGKKVFLFLFYVAQDFSTVCCFYSYTKNFLTNQTASWLQTNLCAWLWPQWRSTIPRLMNSEWFCSVAHSPTLPVLPLTWCGRLVRHTHGFFFIVNVSITIPHLQDLSWRYAAAEVSQIAFCWYKARLVGSFIGSSAWLLCGFGSRLGLESSGCSIWKFSESRRQGFSLGTPVPSFIGLMVQPIRQS